MKDCRVGAKGLRAMATRCRGFWGRQQRKTANHLDVSPL